jgi:hypothetical protein
MVSQRSSSVTTASLLALEDLQLVLVQTAPLWEEMRGQCLFVSGGTGFFGCWLLESFCHINRSLGLGARAVVLTRDPETFRAKCPHLAAEAAIRLVPGDVREFPFPEGDFPYVIHAATETNTGPIVEAQRNLLDSITRGTERMLRFGSERGTRKFLFVSSGAVYGRQPVEMTHVPESYSGAPNPMESATRSSARSPAAGLFAALIFRSTAISRSGTSSATPWPAAPFGSPGTARRGDRTCMPPTWRSGSGRCSSAPRRSRRSTSVRIGTLAFSSSPAWSPASSIQTSKWRSQNPLCQGFFHLAMFRQ